MSEASFEEVPLQDLRDGFQGQKRRVEPIFELTLDHEANRLHNQSIIDILNAAERDFGVFDADFQEGAIRKGPLYARKRLLDICPYKWDGGD